MIHSLRISPLLATLVFVSSLSVSAGDSISPTYANTRKSLASMGDRTNSGDQLKRLFRIGDQRIGDLIRALEESDRRVRLNAQIVIRYLGNAEGMRVLVNRIESGQENLIAGSVPIPLSEWDYAQIKSRLGDGPGQSNVQVTDYIYALALDGSARAKDALRQLSEGPWGAHYAEILGDITRAASRDPFPEGSSLSMAVKQNASFLDPNDQRIAKARMIGFNGAGDKALIVLYIDNGPLAERWYHVVVEKYAGGWRFFSISLVGMS